MQQDPTEKPLKPNPPSSRVERLQTSHANVPGAVRSWLLPTSPTALYAWLVEILKICLQHTKPLTVSINRQSRLRSLIIKAYQDPTFSFCDPAYYHTMHCVDFVRQQILCHADGTLIHKRPWDKDSGDGDVRVCNNFDALTHWTKEYGYQSFWGGPFVYKWNICFCWAFIQTLGQPTIYLDHTKSPRRNFTI